MMFFYLPLVEVKVLPWPSHCSMCPGELLASGRPCLHLRKELADGIGQDGRTGHKPRLYLQSTPQKRTSWKLLGQNQIHQQWLDLIRDWCLLNSLFLPLWLVPKQQCQQSLVVRRTRTSIDLPLPFLTGCTLAELPGSQLTVQVFQFNVFPYPQDRYGYSRWFFMIVMVFKVLIRSYRKHWENPKVYVVFTLVLSEMKHLSCTYSNKPLQIHFVPHQDHVYKVCCFTF